MASAFGTVEHITADIAHTLPAFLPVWKRVSKGQIRVLINEGRTDLHIASEQLQRVDCKEALEVACGQLYRALCKQSETLRSEGEGLSQQLNSLKCRQIFRKYGVYRLIVHWKDRAQQYKHTVWSESDRALIDLINGSRSNNAPPAPADTTLAPAGPLSSPSQITMVSADSETSTGISEEDGNCDDSFVSLEFYVSPETLDSDSVFRNHWECSS
ncbi:hypothetical protein VTO73DRAFT_1834 [Trametes versicolor]